MTNNANTIAQFFLAKGVSPAVVAGIVGNLMVESSTNPGAWNANEGALGIAQWEGGRLTNLKNFASQTGGDPNSLDTQLNFLWHEMNTSESSAWKHVQGATSAGQAASLWDQYYERSSGAARSQRVNYAEQYASTGTLSGASSFAQGVAHSYSGAQSQAVTPTDYSTITDGLGALLTHIPELNTLLNKAKAGDWPLEEFQNQVENSTWYRTHGEAYRSLIALKYSDPTTYNQKLTQDTATAQMQVRQIAASYGMSWVSDGAVKAQADAIVNGSKSLDSVKHDYLTTAKSMFPGLSTQLDSGQTVADIASPYVSTMAGLLEVNPSSLSPTTSLIKQALQGLPDSSTGKSIPQVVPLWQFENMVRKDPRWQYTQNAQQDAATKLMQIGSTWGYNG